MTSTSHVDKFYTVYSIFRDHGWIETDKNVLIDQALKGCVEIVERLSDEEYRLFCHLLRKFHRVGFGAYPAAMSRTLQQLTPPTGPHTFRMAPLLASKNRDKSKSGPDIVRDFVSFIWPSSVQFGHYELVTRSLPVALPIAKNAGANTTTILVDDFIGSGKSALECLTEYGESRKQPSERVIVFCIVAMKAGRMAVSKQGYEIFCDVEIGKGIADCPVWADKSLAYKLMDQMEAFLELSPEYRRGYQQSEALVTLKNTPNNTFPIFWSTRGVNSTVWPCPFPRRK